MSAATPRKPCISLRWPLIGLLLLIAATSGFLGLEASREATQPLPVTQVAASHASLPPGTIDRNGVRYRPIQTYQPCDRALGKNPELTAIDRANFGPEPDPATWKLLTLLAPKIDGSTADVSIVQPPEWLAEHNPQIGSTVPIWVPECGIDGNARVLSIAPCPPVKPGTGPVVLATFRHHVDSTINVHVTGLADPIGCTSNHPFWSEDRQTFIRADALRQGEHLSAIAQDAYVTHIAIDPTPKFVYNLMVQGEHVYYVSHAAVLVHNGDYLCPKGQRIAFGLEKYLDDFADARRADSYKRFVPKPDERALKSLMEDGEELFVNLKGMGDGGELEDIHDVIELGMQGPQAPRNTTNWEVFEMYTEHRSRTKFYWGDDLIDDVDDFVFPIDY